jgi:hypothetical protein
MYRLDLTLSNVWVYTISCRSDRPTSGSGGDRPGAGGTPAAFVYANAEAEQVARADQLELDLRGLCFGTDSLVGDGSNRVTDSTEDLLFSVEDPVGFLSSMVDRLDGPSSASERSGCPGVRVWSGARVGGWVGFEGVRFVWFVCLSRVCPGSPRCLFTGATRYGTVTARSEYLV